MKRLLQMSVRAYLKSVMAPMMALTIVSPVIPIVLYYILDEAINSAIAVVTASMLTVVVFGF